MKNPILNFAAALSGICLAASLLVSCSSAEPKVMARYVPERMDDFVWENDCIIYRAYGEKLEVETLSPGFDIWVKNTPELVANQWYIDDLSGVRTYHHDAGQGKDCYKVGVSLGAGASAPLVDGRLCFPATNFREWEIVSQSPSSIVFALIYPEWNAGGNKVSLRKEITVCAGTNFCEVVDYYSGDFETLTIAAGIMRHNVASSRVFEDGFAFWEEASDQSQEPEDGMIGLGLKMENADAVVYDGPDGHAIVFKTINNGQTVSYRFGCTWSKGNIGSWEDWVKYVEQN